MVCIDLGTFVYKEIVGTNIQIGDEFGSYVF